MLRGDQHCAPKRAVGEDKAKSLLAKNAGRQYPLRVPMEGLKLNLEPPLREVTRPAVGRPLTWGPLDGEHCCRVRRPVVHLDRPSGGQCRWCPTRRAAGQRIAAQERRPTSLLHGDSRGSRVAGGPHDGRRTMSRIVVRRPVPSIGTTRAAAARVRAPRVAPAPAAAAATLGANPGMLANHNLGMVAEHRLGRRGRVPADALAGARVAKRMRHRAQRLARGAEPHVPLMLRTI